MQESKKPALSDPWAPQGAQIHSSFGCRWQLSQRAEETQCRAGCMLWYPNFSLNPPPRTRNGVLPSLMSWNSCFSII